MKRIATTRQDRFLFKRRLISVAVMSAVSGHAGANPTGPQVVHGQAGMVTQGSVLTVTNSPNAIVNWQGFSIGSNETTRFVQQSAASAVLNRVVGVDPSVILGTLQSNGKVFLINTNGILFGQGARVDVAGLVASTLNLNDADFLAGRLSFQSGALASGSVVNRGTIATPEGGSVFLVGAAVENSGIIHAPGGEVILAAGQTVRLGSTGAPNVLVEIEAPANQAVNLGEIAVGAGKAGIYGGFVEQKGIVSADTATINAAGKIVFKATRDTTVAAASVTSANGGKGGLISVESGGTSFIEGVVSATGASGTGGKIQLLGGQVGVIGGAVVDASGVAGGGTVLVGGDYKGGNPDVNARATFLGAHTLLRADATGAGDGGRIIVWSDEVTRAYGGISARGGAQGGDGGFVETSSAGFLDVIFAPDLSAPAGAGGSWLLDPFNILVTISAGTLDGLTPNFVANGDNSTVSNTAIQTALNAGQNVIIQTGSSGTQAGDITVDAPITMTAAGSALLSLLAANNIYLTANGDIASTAGALSVILNSDRDQTAGGAVWLQSGSSIVTSGGSLTIGGGANPATTVARASGDILEGVRIEGASINTGAGAISIRGEGTGTGVVIKNSATAATTVRSSNGDITIVGLAGAGAGDGVRIASDNSVLGVVVNTIGTGNITISGSVPVGNPVSAGVAIVQAGVDASGSAGSVTITGSNMTTGSTAYAVHIDGGGTGASASSFNGVVQIQSTAGSIVTESATSSATVAAYAGDVLMSSAGPIVLAAGTEVTAGQNVEIHTDDLDESARFIQSGTAAANYVRWAPTTPGLNLHLTDIQSANYITPRLQIGNPGGSTFGTVTIQALAEPSDFSAMTRSVEVYAQRVDIDASLGGTTPLPLSFLAHATGDITVGTNAGATIRLGDGQNLTLLADRDANGVGDLTIGLLAPGYVNIQVGTGGSATLSSMDLEGANVTFQGAQNVWLYGPGTQTIVAEQDVLLSNSVPGNFYLSVGSEGLTDVTAGGDVTIQSLGDGVAQIAGDFLSPGGIGAVHLTVAGDVRMANAGSVNSAVSIQAQKGMSINADSLQLVGATGGQAVGINSSQGLQSVTTSGSGPNGWGIELTNNGSLSASDDGVYIKSGGSQQITASNGGGILLDGVGGRAGIFGAAQTISAAGDIVLLGGVDSLQLWAEISSPNGQDITARSLSIVNRAGPSSTGIFTQDGTQRITTTGSAANGYGITIRNLGAKGTDQNGFPASAYIFDRLGTQIIDVADSNGILMEGLGGDVFLGTDGLSQTITLHGGGANRLDLTAGLGNAIISFSNGTAQTITAGAINLAGGTADRAAAVIVAHDGTQTIDVTGTLSLTGGSAHGPSIPDLSNPPADCAAVAACAVVAAHGDLQTISAGGISITGGTDGTENLATILGDFGQDITVGSGGLTMQGGGGPGLRNYAFIEASGGDQILRFAAGAPLTLTGGTTGSKHFAGIQAFTGAASQQILGNPVIQLIGGASGGGDGTGFFATFKGNNAAIVTEPGSAVSQTINAQSIDMQGGGGIDNNAHIGVWGTGASQTITVTGDVRMLGGTEPGTHAEVMSQVTQAITARSILLEGTAGGGPAVIWNTSYAQTITTTGSGANGWGIELTNNAALGEVYITTGGSQQITATNGGGILLDAVGGNVTIRGAVIFDQEDFPISTGTQAILIEGTGANALELRGGAGTAFVEGTNQTIRAGITAPGCILLEGSDRTYGGAWIFASLGTQEVSTTGPLTLVAGSAPDNHQGMYECGVGGACALILARERATSTSTLLQYVSASQIIIQGGSGGAYNEAAIFSEGNQLVTVTGTGGILVQGGAGTGNYATLGTGGTYAQEVQFGSGDLRVVGGTSGGRSYADVASGGGQTITGTGDIEVVGGVPAGAGSPAKFHRPGDPLADPDGYVTDAFVWSYGVISGGNPTTTQCVVANSIFIDALPSQSSTGIWAPAGVQSIATTGAGADGYGLTVRNRGAVGGPEQGGFANAAAFITTNGRQVIDVANSAGLRILGDAGFAIVGVGQLEGAVNRPGVSQIISVHGSGANEILLDAGGGRASLYGYFAAGPDASQSIEAGSPGESGSISILGGTSSAARADITAETGTQTVRTTGQLELVAGSAPDAGQAMYQCSAVGACAQIRALETGRAPGTPLQSITADGILIHGGTGGAYNSAELLSNGRQSVTITGPGGILIQGGAGVGNFARIGMEGGAGCLQTIGFGAGDLRILGGTSGGQSYGEVFSQGNQAISGSGNITVTGGVLPDNGAPAKFYDPSNPAADANGFVFDPVVLSYGIVLGNTSGDPFGSQTITANSITIDALPGQSSTGIFALDGVQTISTTGTGSGGYGLTIRNSGAHGSDQGGFSDATAFVAIRYGRQVIDVANSGGLHIAGEGGWAGIWNGEIALVPAALGVGQSITVHGTGANAILLEGGAGQATIFGNFNAASASQTIVAGLPGEAGSISIRGGSQSKSGAWITAETGTQTISTAGALTLVGGATPSAPGTIDFGQLDCLPACASVLAKAGQQTIEAGSILLQGGASGNENLASIRGNAGQDITINGTGGLQILGGGGLDNDNAFSDFAMIESYAGSQVIRFPTPGASLTVAAGNKGMRHFAGIYNAGTDGGGQQILGNPAIFIRGGTGGSGGGSPDRFRLTGNFAFIGSESGAQQIAASSIDLIAGGGNANVAHLDNWGGDLPGSALGSQTINTVNGLTLEGGTGNNANVRVYSHSGDQKITVGGAMTMRRTAASDVFLGNVFDPAVANLGINAVELNVGTLALEGGNIWGDDGVILRLANGGTATGGAIHAGRVGTPTNGGDIIIDPGTFVTLEGSLTLDGAVDIGHTVGILDLSGGTLTVGNGVSNSGFLQLRTSSLDVPAALVVSGGQLVNAPGAIVQSLTAGGSSANTITAALLNQGLLDVQHSLTLTSAQSAGNSGTIDIASGATLTLSSDYTNTASGVIQGSGTIALPGFTLSNAGIIRPGTSPGTLTIAGNLALTPSSVLDVELEGAGAGQYDVIDVTGAAALDGTLNLLFPSAYQGAKGDSFRIIVAGAVSGTFATINQPVGMGATPGYHPTDVTLTIDTLSNRWTALSGLWTVAGNWSRGRVPTAGEDVEIDVAGTLETITVPSGENVSVGSLLLRDNLLLDTATLNVRTDLLVDSGATLQLFNSNVLGPGAVTNAGSEINGGNVTAAVASVTAGGQLRLLAGTLSTTGALSNEGTVVASGGSLNAGSIDNKSTGGLTINGATVSVGPFTNAGTTTLQSGSLSVAEVTNPGTLNLNGGSFTPGVLFRNSGTVNLNTGTLSLAGGDENQGGGGDYNLASGTTLRFTDGSYGVGSIAGAGNVQIEGASSKATLVPGTTMKMKIAAQTLKVQAGAFAAIVDPTELTLDVPGGVTLTGGTGTDAFASIEGGSVTLTTSTITLTGGSGDGSYAAIKAVSGGATIIASGDVVLVPGAGPFSGAWISAAGPLSITALNCTGCDVLPVDPLQSPTATAGVFGNPVNLLPGAIPLQVPSSVIVGVQTAESGGEGDAVLSAEEEEEKEKEQSTDETRANEEQKNEKPLQVCI